MLSMLEWLCHKMMEVEVENKLGAGKGEHYPNRTGYRSGTVRRFDTRMGTIYLLIPKVRRKRFFTISWPGIMQLSPVGSRWKITNYT
jgi:transposase-like protein